MIDDFHLRQYVEKVGLINIVVIKHNFRESQSALKTRYEDDFVACQKKGRKGYFRMRLSCIADAKGTFKCAIEHEEEITEAEYERIKNINGGIVDDEKFKRRIRERSTRQRRIEEIDEHLKNLARPCPHCGGKLIERKGRHGKFWGCSNYPRCKGIKRLTQDQKKLMEERARLFREGIY